MAVDDTGAAAAVGDRADDQRLTETGISSGEHTFCRGCERTGAKVATAVEAEAELGVRAVLS